MENSSVDNHHVDEFQKLLSNFIEKGLEISEKIRKNTNCHLNIAYGATPREKLDIYGDDLKTDSPLLVFVHGGAWQYCDKWGSSYLAESMVMKGIRVIIVGYDLCPNIKLEQIVEQTKKAFKWIGDYVKKNSIKSVSFSGHSAGAHLVLCSMTKEIIDSFASDVIVFVYAISGFYEFKDNRDHPLNPKNALGLTDKSFRQLSPVFHDFSHLQLRGIKVFIIFGELEYEMTKQYARDLKDFAFKNFSCATLEVINDVDHFTIVEKMVENDYDLTRLIGRNCLAE